MVTTGAPILITHCPRQNGDYQPFTTTEQFKDKDACLTRLMMEY